MNDLFLPKDLLTHFKITDIQALCEVKLKRDIFYIYLEEKNELPKGYKRIDYESKGFYPSKKIQDFPIRGKAVFLIVKRRRWRHKQTKKEIKSDYSFIAKSSRLTEELADFLKVQVETRTDTISNISSYFGVQSYTLQKHYKEVSSGFKQWSQKAHAEQYMLFPENMGEYLSIDEVALSKGELYTFITNKKGKGKKGTIVASIRGTKSQDIIDVLEKLPIELRKKVKEVTLDMAKNIEFAVRMSFPEAYFVTDRFHVVKLVMESLQHIRIKYRWEELDKENKAIIEAKEQKIKYKPIILSNGDTPKQLLARSRYILAKKPNDFTENQKLRSELLFKRYPKIETAYKHTLEFRSIYENTDQLKAIEKFNFWIEDTFENKLETFYTTANTVKANFENILNFFRKRNTNANAESFNAKIKLFRANLRGVSDTQFFLFRLSKLFA